MAIIDEKSGNVDNLSAQELNISPANKQEATEQKTLLSSIGYFFGMGGSKPDDPELAQVLGNQTVE